MELLQTLRRIRACEGDVAAQLLLEAYVAQEVATKCADLRKAAEYAAHKLEGARIWNGQEWHYNPLHPLHYRSALERLRDVLRA